ncbi:hypothetical protein ACLBR5_12870 [Escherichia coli]
MTSNEIDSDALYLDEITLTSEQDAVLRYGQVEVPLPPGADVERTTWGISVNKPNAAKQQGQLLEKARNEMGKLAYGAGERTDGNGRISAICCASRKKGNSFCSCSLCAFYAPAQQSVAAGSE